MKTINSIIIAAFMAAACSGNGNKMSVQDITYSDSTSFINFNASFQLPAGNDNVSRTIRQQLVQIASDQLNGMLVYEDDIPITPISSTEELIEQCISTKDSLNALSKDDYGMRRSIIMEYPELSSQEKQEMLSYIPTWDEDMAISLLADTTDYCVFLSQNYFYLGGAHGGISGAGYLTFLKSDGSLFMDFLTGDCCEGMQPLLRKGIADYLLECGEQVEPEDIGEYLLIFGEDSIIPLPQYQPCPGPEGLTFMYQQYEITPYAMGMPEFTISYSDLEPFMTEQARSLFF